MCASIRFICCSIRFICALHKVHTCTSFQYQEYLCSVVEGVVGLGELVEGVVGLGELWREFWPGELVKNTTEVSQ